MNTEYITNLSSMVDKTTEEMTLEFEAYKTELSEKYKGRLTGDKLEQRTQALFSQKYRAERVSQESNGTKPFNFRIMGISDTKDKLSYPRKEAVELYEANPNKYVMEGYVVEYTEVDDGFLKRYYDYFDKSDKTSPDYEIVKEVTIEKVPETAVAYGEDTGVWLGPVDRNEFSFGDKVNPNYGIEYPKDKLSRYAFGIAEPQDGSDGAKWAKLMLRGANTKQDMPEINKSYVVRALSFTKNKEEEYNLIDTQKKALFVEVDWNPFAPEPFMESVLTAEFVQKKTVLLGEVEAFLKKTEAQREARTFKKWNDAILVEVDIMDIVPGDLDPEKDWSDKIIVDDPSLRADFDLEKIQSNVTCWGSRANKIDFGRDSRVILTCYPSRGRKAEGEEKGPLRLNVYGTYALEELKTDFDLEDFRKEDL